MRMCGPSGFPILYLILRYHKSVVTPYGRGPRASDARRSPGMKGHDGNFSRHPGGIKAISRGLRESATPGFQHGKHPIPEGSQRRGGLRAIL